MPLLTNELVLRLALRVSTKIGVASAAKMLAQRDDQGIEALTVGMPARRASLRRRVPHRARVAARDVPVGRSASTTPTCPVISWSRVAEHGSRRAAEMREVAQTLRDADIEPFMSEACARLQDGVADVMEQRALDYASFSVPFDWRNFFDRLGREGS